MGKFDHLLAPMTIRGHVYRNRIMAAPTLFAHSAFIPEIRENVFRMVENRAKGGCAQVTTGEICFNFEEGICDFIDRKIDFDDYTTYEFNTFKEYAHRMKKHGAVAMMEFSHEAARANVQEPYVPYGPSPFIREDGKQVYEMTEEIMDKICNDIRRACKYMKKAGFDGIIFHGGHGFIIQQFISRWTNKRTDKYGGSMENRARFPKRFLEAMREAMGEDMILELRMSAEDGVEEDGCLKIDETVEFFKLIDGIPDIIHVSNGLKWAGNHTFTFTDMYDPHGYNVQFAEKVKKAVTKSRVAVIGGINSPEFAEEIIAEGKTDFVIMGRQMYADPEFANKVSVGREDTIRRCVRCYQCYPGTREHPTDLPFDVRFSTEEEMRRVFNPASMGRCAINPKSNFRLYPERYPIAEAKRRVLIAGGGVAGCQAAISAAERGYIVTLCEKTDKLGGTINFTDKDPDKADLMNAKNVIINDMLESGTRVLMNTTVTSELIEAEKPDVLIIAVGADPIRPNIPGIEKAVSALDVYNNIEKAGDKVALIGGGLVGVEVGLFLKGMGKDVTVIEMQNIIAREAWCMYRNALMEEIEKRQLTYFLETSCKAITENGIIVENNGKERIIPADTVVYSVGMRSRKDIVDSLKAAAKKADVKQVFVIGDCLKPGKVGDAVPAAHLAALQIN